MSQAPANQNRNGTPFVLDNSVLCGWFLANQASDYGDTIAHQLSQVDAHAPWLLQLEFSNVLRTACRRGSLPIAMAQEIIDRVMQLPIRIDGSPPLPAALLSLALRFNLTSYDAAYLELALRLQLPIATRDADLAEAAWAAGVGVMPG